MFNDFLFIGTLTLIAVSILFVMVCFVFVAFARVLISLTKIKQGFWLRVFSYELAVIVDKLFPGLSYLILKRTFSPE